MEIFSLLVIIIASTCMWFLYKDCISELYNRSLTRAEESRNKIVNRIYRDKEIETATSPIESVVLRVAENYSETIKEFEVHKHLISIQEYKGDFSKYKKNTMKRIEDMKSVLEKASEDIDSVKKLIDKHNKQDIVSLMAQSNFNLRKKEINHFRSTFDKNTELLKVEMKELELMVAK